MTVHWENLASLIDNTVLYYIATAHHGNLSRAAVVSGDLYSANVLGLLTYTEYQVNVFGIDSHGQPQSSSNVTALTEEGGKFFFFLFDGIRIGMLEYMSNIGKKMTKRKQTFKQK